MELNIYCTFSNPKHSESMVLSLQKNDTTKYFFSVLIKHIFLMIVETQFSSANEGNEYGVFNAISKIKDFPSLKYSFSFATLIDLTKYYRS